MVLWSRLVIFGLVVVFHGSANGTIQNQVQECIRDCHNKRINNKIACEHVCLDEFVPKVLLQDKEEKLPMPGAPILVSSEFTSIRLTWNTSGLSNQTTAVNYVLEIETNWSNWSYRGNDTLYPYIGRYRLTNETVYSVQGLLARTSFCFRVLALTASGKSNFSDWSGLISTNDTCEDSFCTVTNVQLQIAPHFPNRRHWVMNSTFYWEPATFKGLGRFEQAKLTVQSLVTNEESYCHQRLTKNYEFLEDINNSHAFLKNKSRSYHKLELRGSEREELYLDCWYKVQIGKTSFFHGSTFGSWIFRTPACFEMSRLCACPYPELERRKGVIRLNITLEPANTSLVVVTWTNERWQAEINVTFFAVHLIHKDHNRVRHQRTQYVDFDTNVRDHNVSFYKLLDGMEYDVEISAHDEHFCVHGKREEEKFRVVDPCTENRTHCEENSACYNVLGFGKCHCNRGFDKINDICVENNPCDRNPCGENEVCYTTGTPRYSKCRCAAGFVDVDGVCQEPTSSSNTAKIVVAVVIPLVMVTIVVVVVLLWIRYSQKRRLRTLENVMESVLYNNSSETITFNNPYGYQHPNVGVNGIPKSGKGFFDGDREVNLLYVPQEISEAIARGLMDGVFELPDDRLKLGQVIGKGAFGEVHVGEALGIADNSGWTAVAVKKLADSVTRDEIEDFFDEIKLMKRLGKHQNVIQMYGCCTVNPPICLIMEYAAGGNLLDYLRSLKRKCERIAIAKEESIAKELPMYEKGKFDKFYEPSEVPEESEAHSFPRNDYKQSFDAEMDDNVKQMEAWNTNVATRINLEIQSALNPKELESFARQIANGMTHVADLGIVHRDLAARNILLDDNNILKISDFGLSREGEVYVKKTRGKIPFRWLSIEAIRERRYTTASDVWAFGIVLWEICTLGDVPYPSVGDKDLEGFLVSGKRLEKTPSCTDDIYEVMLRCWSHQPENRPTFDELSTYLWELEHDGSAYVNIDPLVESSTSPAVGEDPCHDSPKDVDLKKNPNPPSDPETGSTNSLIGCDNLGFMQGMQDLDADNEARSLSRYYKDQSKSKLDENGIACPQPAS